MYYNIIEIAHKLILFHNKILIEELEIYNFYQIAEGRVNDVYNFLNNQ